MNVNVLSAPKASGGVIGFTRHWLNESASAWDLPGAAVGLILALPILIALVGVLLALTSKDLYTLFTREDGIAENLQVTFYTFALALSVLLIWRQWRAGERLIALLYLCLGLAFFFLIGEEVSWGQRIFGWHTTATLAEINRQGETNLHNINGVEGAFRWIELLMGVGGTLLPLLVMGWVAPLRLQKLIAAAIPHYTFVPYFFMLFIWKIYRNFFFRPETHHFAIAEYSEVVELIIALAFFLFMVFQLRKLNREKYGLSIAALMAERSNNTQRG